jgi:hypothetical protein
MLPFLVELSEFVSRVYAVVQNMLRQLASLYHPQSKLYADCFRGIHLTSLLERLAGLFTVLITLDCIFTQNDVFKQRCVSGAACLPHDG